MTVELAHEPGEEIQFDWLELHETPWGEPAYVLVGALSFSGRCRAVICEGMTFAHLIDAIDGGLYRRSAGRLGLGEAGTFTKPNWVENSPVEFIRGCLVLDA